MPSAPLSRIGLLLAVAACGGDDSDDALDATGAPIMDAAVEATMVTDAPEPQPPLDAGHADAAAVAAVDAAPCTRRWTRVASGRAGAIAARIENGALVLAAPDLRLGDLMSVRAVASAQGDFEASFTFEMFAPRGPAAFLRAVAAPDSMTNAQALAAVGGGTLSIAFRTADGTSVMRAGEIVKGTLAWKRSNEQLTATVTGTMGDPVTSTQRLSGGPLALAIELGGTGVVDGPTSVRITDFSYAGGGTLKSDAFDCDSLPR